MDKADKNSKKCKQSHNLESIAWLQKLHANKTQMKEKKIKGVKNLRYSFFFHQYAICKQARQ